MNRERRRAFVAVIGLAGGFVTWAAMSAPGNVPDFIYPWTAARHLLAGRNPYHALPGGLPFPFQGPLFYPLPTVLATVPVAWLPLPLAAAVLSGCASAALAYALMRSGREPLFVFLSAPYLVAAALGQWSPLIVVAALLPAAGFLAVLKPNLGAAVFLARPSWYGAIGIGVVLAASFLILPSWLGDWLRGLAQLEGPSAHHPAPLFTLAGAPLALALLRWRRWEARLLLLMAGVPQVLFFADQLPLWLVPNRRREYALLSAASLVAFGAAYAVYVNRGGPLIHAAEPLIIPMLYWPALWMVLRRPNEGDVPAWIERLASYRTRRAASQLETAG